jgi:hypothetical protein
MSDRFIDPHEAARLMARIQERRNDPVFMRRLKQLVEDEREVLERLALNDSADPSSREQAPAAIPVDVETAGGKDDNPDGMICT